MHLERGLCSVGVFFFICIPYLRKKLHLSPNQYFVNAAVNASILEFVEVSLFFFFYLVARACVNLFS
jgi:hypothetical protein